VTSAPTAVNTQVWASGNFFDEYHSRDLRPVEADILLRYREELSGRVLELGCGAGRVSGYLVELAREAHGLDISPRMLDYCRHTWPQGHWHEGNFNDLSMFEDGSIDALFATCNILDILTDDERGEMLDKIHRVIAPDGLLMMSAHNLGYVPRLRTPTSVRAQLAHPRAFAIDVARMPRRIRNRRRLLPLEQRGPGWALLNDGVYDFSMLHYFIARDAQEQQLREHGFELLECLDLEGRRVEPGADASETVELHYVARRD
jgi:SAM-dependent methyltransferase